MTPVFAALSIVDYGVLALYLALIVGLGFYFASRQRTAQAFFLGSRSFNAFPLGMSLTATLVSALAFSRLSGEAYEHGLKCLLVPLAVWIVLPVLVAVVLPICRGLGLSTLYEYLELRFDARLRHVGSLVFLAWRLLWLAGMIYIPCHAIIVASDLRVPPWPLVIGLGLIATAYALLGGMQAVVWANVIQGLAMFGGIAVMIAGAWGGLAGGPDRVMEVAQGLGRMTPADFQFDWQENWSLWGALPYWMLLYLAFYAADQVTAQRFLAAKNVDAARTSCVIHAVAISVLHAGLVYVGLCLLAYYNDHPQAMRPEWVANVDHLTRGPVRGADGRPLIDPAQPLTPANVHELVRQGKLLKPNSKEPFTSVNELLDAETGQLLIEKLAMRRPTPGKIRGEIIVARGAPEKMLPQFIADHLPWGAAGLAIVALVAACMASIDSGINSIGAILVMDLHRRLGLGKAWLARRLGKPAQDLTEEDEMRLARPLTLVVGIGATLLALLVSQTGDVYSLPAAMAGILGAPLLGVFLLGMFTRRCTAAGALAALFGGALFALGLTAYIKLAAAGMAPRGYAPSETWVVTLGVAATLVLGYSASLVLGRRKTNVELRGLVWGCGQMGVPASEEEVTVIGELEAVEPAAEPRTLPRR